MRWLDVGCRRGKLATKSSDKRNMKILHDAHYVSCRRSVLVESWAIQSVAFIWRIDDLMKITTSQLLYVARIHMNTCSICDKELRLLRLYHRYVGKFRYYCSSVVKRYGSGRTWTVQRLLPATSILYTVAMPDSHNNCTSTSIDYVPDSHNNCTSTSVDSIITYVRNVDIWELRACIILVTDLTPTDALCS